MRSSNNKKVLWTVFFNPSITQKYSETIIFFPHYITISKTQITNINKQLNNILKMREKLHKLIKIIDPY